MLTRGGGAVTALLTGMLTGLSLIVAIGAQNSYVLRQGLLRQHVWLVVTICAASDALLILAGTAGIGALIEAAEGLLTVLTWLGALYLIGYGLFALRRATRPAELLPSANATPTNRRTVIATTLAFTYLNPHVYLDTVILLGTTANQFDAQKWIFATGAALGSVLWFSFLGFGATKAAPLMARPLTWRILDVAIATIMFAIAITLIRGL